MAPPCPGVAQASGPETCPIASGRFTTDESCLVRSGRSDGDWGLPNSGHVCLSTVGAAGPSRGHQQILRPTSARVPGHDGCGVFTRRKGGGSSLGSLLSGRPRDLITPKASPPNTVSLGARILHMDLGGHALQSVAESPSSGQHEAGAPGAAIRGAGGRGRSPAVGFAGSLRPCEAVRGGGQPPQEGEWPRGRPRTGVPTEPRFLGVWSARQSRSPRSGTVLAAEPSRQGRALPRAAVAVWRSMNVRAHVSAERAPCPETCPLRFRGRGVCSESGGNGTKAGG